MATTWMKRCAAGSSLTTREDRIAAAIMLGGTLALTAVYPYVSVRYRGHALVDAFGILLITDLPYRPHPP